MRGTNQFFEEEFIKRKRICHWTKCKVKEPIDDIINFHIRSIINSINRYVCKRKQRDMLSEQYMYTAMADLAYHNGDKELLDSCKSLWRDIRISRFI